MDASTEIPPPSVVAAAAPPSRPSAFPGREDCWSEDATFTLIDAWGSRHLQLNRGNLRQSHWQEVAAAVNLRHGHDRRSRRTDVQCKNRIDTLKKKYKLERARAPDSSAVGDGDAAAGGYSGAWPFFHAIDSLIGDTFQAKKQLPPPVTRRKSAPAFNSPPWTVTPVAPRSGTQRRPAPGSVEDSYFRRSFMTFARAAVAAAVVESGDLKGGGERRKRGRKSDFEEEEWEMGYRELAEAIERVGEIYERVEGAKRRQMVELEKQRMQFAKDLECQRMQLFMETQLHLLKINRSSKRDPARAADSFS